MQLTSGGQLTVGVTITLAVGLAMLFAPEPYTLIAVTFLPLVVWIVLEAPFITILVFWIFTGIRLHEALPGLANAPLALLSGMLAVIAAFWHIVVRRTHRPDMTPEMKWYLLMVAVSFLGIVTSYNRQATFDFVTDSTIKQCIGFAVLMWLMRTGTDLRIMGVTILLSGFTVSAAALANVVFNPSAVPGQRIRLTGMLGDPNDLVLSLLPALGLAAAFIWRRVNLSLMVISAAFIVILLGVLFNSESRGGMLGLATVLFVLAYLEGRLRAVIILGCLSVPVVLAMLARLALREDLAGVEGLDESAESRLTVWRAAIMMGLTRPLGVGTGNFVEALAYYTSRYDLPQLYVAHSTWFQALGEQGVFGLAFLIAMIAASFRSLFLSRTVMQRAGAPPMMQAIAAGLLAGLAGYCVSSTFVIQTGWMLPMLVVISAVLRRHVENAYPEHVKAPGSSTARAAPMQPPRGAGLRP